MWAAETIPKGIGGGASTSFGLRVVSATLYGQYEGGSTISMAHGGGLTTPWDFIFFALVFFLIFKFKFFF
jgi:hypothetical protein